MIITIANNGDKVKIDTKSLPAIVADVEKTVAAYVESDIILTVDMLISLLIVAKGEMETPQ